MSWLSSLSVTIAFLALTLDSFSQAAPVQKKVAILIYDGVYLLDFAGPLEVFNDAMANDSTKAFEVYLVAEKKESVKAHTGTSIIPDYTIDDCPEPDLIIIPGGELQLAKSNKKIAEWIITESKRAEITMSVCTGAFILADLGLLDGQEAITWWGAAARLQKLYPKIKVAEGNRFTDNGRIITTAGVSAGIDGSLHVVARLFGREAALKTARYIEYKWTE